MATMTTMMMTPLRCSWGGLALHPSPWWPAALARWTGGNPSKSPGYIRTHSPTGLIKDCAHIAHDLHDSQEVGTQGPRGSRGGPTTYMVQGGQLVGLQGLRGSRGRPLGSQGVKGQACRVPGVNGQTCRVLGLKGWAIRVLGGQRVGLMGLLMIQKAYMPIHKWF